MFGALGVSALVVFTPVGTLWWQEMVQFFVKFVKESHNFFFLKHMRDDGAVTRPDFETGVDFGDGRLTDFESVGDISLRASFHEHIGDGETFAQHNLLDGREEIIEEVCSFLGRGERGE